MDPENVPVTFTFTLVLDGCEIAVKVVEPEMDVPLPEDGRLVMEIVSRDDVKAWIEMSQGKARLAIKSQGENR